jgi:hypothetical protein
MQMGGFRAIATFKFCILIPYVNKLKGYSVFNILYTCLPTRYSLSQIITLTLQFFYFTGISFCVGITDPVSDILSTVAWMIL